MGYSKYAQRRLIPALSALGATRIDVASRTRADDVRMPIGVSARVLDAYDTALAQSRAEVVYVSVRNRDHAQWVEAALRCGFHVIVDKPAFTHLAEAYRLVKFAQHQGCCLAEATVYAYHPQIRIAQDVFTQVDRVPNHLSAAFSFPPLAADNFRYCQAYGGGALWDLGPYAMTPGRLFFNAEPETITCQVTAWDGEVDTAFSVFTTYSGDRSMTGHFGFNASSYRNQLDISGSDTTVHIERVFTTPAEMANPLMATYRDQAQTVVVPPCDQVMVFLRRVAQAIDTGEHHAFAQTLMSDAVTLDRLRRAAGVAEGLSILPI